MRLPLRYQFMLPLLAVAALSLLVIAVVNARVATTSTKDRIEQQLRGVVGVLTQSSYPLTTPVLEQMSGLAGARFVLTDDAGGVLAKSGDFAIEDLSGREPPADSNQPLDLGREVTLPSGVYYHSAVRVERRPGLAAQGVLHVLFARDDYNTAWRRAFLPPLLVGVATLAAVALVTHLMTARVSRVLARLGAEVRRLADGDFSSVHEPEWNDEARDLARAVNDTAGRLEEYESQLKRTERLRAVSMLGAGLAHEMRNAATGCRLAIDLHAESCAADRSGPADDSLEVARRQLVLMESRLKQLLQLGQPQQEPRAEELIDFGDLVDQSVELIAPAARHARVDLQWSPPAGETPVRVDAELVSQAVLNLLLNALEAAAKSAGSQGPPVVCVELTHEPRGCVLSVADSGEGPDDGSKNGDLFEPFVTSKAEGVGLGLAVARRAAENHGGSIQWRRSGGFTWFVLRLPLAEQGVAHA